LEKGGKIKGGGSRKEAGMKKKDEIEGEWNRSSEEVIREVTEWREEHPKATLREIEAEIDLCLSKLRAKMITDTANQSMSARWEAAEGRVCPECGAKLIQKGKQKRVLLTKDGREIELEREHGVCAACGQGIFPPV
jgi:YgiT-type zinc finger domain-containing protein